MIATQTALAETLTIQFGSDPLRTEDLIKRIFQEIEQLKANGPTEKQVTVEKEKLLRQVELDSKRNEYWLAQILFRYQNGEDPATILKIPEYYNKIDAAMIQEAAKAYLNPKNYVKVTLVPEKKKE